MLDRMIDNVTTVEKKNLLEAVNNMKLKGYRFAAMTCVQENDIFELDYHFDLNFEMEHIKIVVNQTDEITSISKIFPAAFLIENEYQDLYGLKFKGLIVDYKGALYLTPNSPKTPMVNNKAE
ncbi:NADH-quinone oxidoreductase subunit C [Fervidicella metallireducens]|nr:NADH-quinone oxidoreductase subunit C [Fervidicella metallireducens]